jgi:probable rRNA maturation factor
VTAHKAGVTNDVTVVIDEPQWKRMRGLAARLAAIAAHAIARGTRSRKKKSVTILLTHDEAVHKLNRRFRKKDKPTDVLSFPAAPNRENYLGDVAIAFGVTAREARQSRKRFSDHAQHLAVHGVLHLLGYDHERGPDARRMERLEAKILGEFGLPDPYETPPNPA